jgi:hypothetical protein
LWHRLAPFLIVFVSLSLVFSSVAYYATSNQPAQPFMSFGISSSHGLQQYIPNSNLTITPPQTTNWTITIGNEMNTAQFAMVVVRLGNSTTQSPNSTTPTPTAPELSATQMFLGIGETSQLSFSWTVQSVYQTGNLVLLNMYINGQSTAGQLQIGAISGRNFRLIFELWTYDITTGSFEYGYPGMNGTVGEWLQVWFNVAS